jgi:hypothetical protein
MIFSPKNKLFKKENIFIQSNPLEFGSFSRKCNLHKEENALQKPAKLFKGLYIIVGLKMQFSWTKNAILLDQKCQTENSKCWTKLHFV